MQRKILVSISAALALPLSAAALLTSGAAVAGENQPLPQQPCFGQQATQPATTGDDHAQGTDGADVFSMLTGSDQVEALEGRDRLCGGGGQDFLNAGAGRDLVYGGPGQDWIFGDADLEVGGDDELYGSKGSDLIVGVVGDDVLRGGKHDDVLDFFPFSANSDENNLIQAGADRVFGGRGNDLIDENGDGSVDTIDCGPGDDTVYADSEDRVAKNCENVFRDQDPDNDPPVLQLRNGAKARAFLQGR